MVAISKDVAMKIAGSVAVTPYSKLEIILVKAKATKRPRMIPVAANFIPWLRTSLRTSTGLAPRAMDAEFMDPLRHRVADHAVNTQGCKQQRQTGKETD